MERSMKALRFTLLAGAVFALVGCDSIRSAAGLSKSAPDEFAVVTKAPLIMPPDYNLHPPKPGAPPLNQTPPTQSAEASLFSSDPSAVASTMTGNYSQGEKLLLATAGAVATDPTIRQQIAADNANLEASDPDFTDRVLFGATDTNGRPVDADVEAQRLGKTSPEKMTEEGTTDQGDVAPDTSDDESSDSDSGGWFGWLGDIF